MADNAARAECGFWSGRGLSPHSGVLSAAVGAAWPVPPWSRPMMRGIETGHKTPVRPVFAAWQKIAVLLMYIIKFDCAVQNNHTDCAVQKSKIVFLFIFIVDV
ncbi:hypothetical protein RI056_07765 [Komagataeibacter nataicola]|uniref:hypothetical protein n=1 Tax=Komagataeibacter nataicola TaxID=265960 RepID=UPI0028B0EE79|nr:hypothetical protein [Komagataeibacter nataicola]WNM10224.1 hypothetical protein RI056_07765 [Komagataeibacter nataicola]